MMQGLLDFLVVLLMFVFGCVIGFFVKKELYEQKQRQKVEQEFIAK